MHWSHHAIWYAIYPLGFVDAPVWGDRSTGHRLERITAWLDYIVQLGCNGLLLGPIFQSATHGYDTLDYYRIDDRLGDDSDIDLLIAQCHNRGIRIMFDGVFNHVSDAFPLLTSTLTDQQHDDWFHLNRDHDPVTWLNFEGSNDLVRLNHANPQVRSFIIDVMKYWLARGIDGWRLDAAYAVDPQAWAVILQQVRQDYPDALFTGEVIHADMGWIEQSTLRSITGYELWKATWSSINDVNFYELDWAMKRHGELSQLVRPLTFVSNHDVTRIATKVGIPASIPAVVIMMTAAGMPAVYYGDEGGVEGEKFERPRGDDDIRRPLASTPDQWKIPNPAMLDIYRELIAVRRNHPWMIDASVETLELDNPSITYRVSSGDDWLDVSLTVGDRVTASISNAGGVIFDYSATTD